MRKSSGSRAARRRRAATVYSRRTLEHRQCQVPRLVAPNPRSVSTQKAPVCPVDAASAAPASTGRSVRAALASKDTRVAELFADVADASALRPILGMDEPYYYRNKVVSPYAPGASCKAPRTLGRGRGATRAAAATASAPRSRAARSLCGMYAAGSHRIVPTDGCLIENEEAKRIIRTVRDLMPRFRYRAVPRGFRHGLPAPRRWCAWDIPAARSWSSLVTNGRAFPASRAFCESWCAAALASRPVVHERERAPDQRNSRRARGRRCTVRASSWTSCAAELSHLVAVVLPGECRADRGAVTSAPSDLAGFTGSETAIDAYCVSRQPLVWWPPSAARAPVIGVDTVASARARRAREREAQRRGERSVRGGRCRGVHARARRRSDAVDVLLMDPPRARVERRSSSRPQ